MITVLFWGEFRAGFSGDPIAEDGSLAFELARFVIATDPVGDLIGITGL